MAPIQPSLIFSTNYRGWLSITSIQSAPLIFSTNYRGWLSITSIQSAPLTRMKIWSFSFLRMTNSLDTQPVKLKKLYPRKVCNQCINFTALWEMPTTMTITTLIMTNVYMKVNISPPNSVDMADKSAWGAPVTMASFKLTISKVKAKWFIQMELLRKVSGNKVNFT